MLHYTLNTGHTRHSPSSEVSVNVIDILTPLLTTGEHPLPSPAGYSMSLICEGRALMATVYDDAKKSCATFAVAPDDKTADTLWPEVEAHYHSITELPGFRSADFAAARRPLSTPWCAAITTLATPEEAYWIADLERCVAWAWLGQCIH